MERKTFSSGDKFTAEKDQMELLPKVPMKIKESPYITSTSKKIGKKYSDYSVKTQESDINLLSKFPRVDNNFFSNPSYSEERKELRLPVLNKKENKKSIISSVSNYRSPRLSPTLTRSELEVSKKDEKIEEIESIDCQNEVFKSPMRGSSASRGFRSRKSKTRPGKQSSKQRDDNLDTLLMYRNNSDFEFLMTEYIRRQGLEGNTKIFILTGQHEFIRRALKKRGWVENKNANSCAYHLKWCFNDSDYDYKALKPGQAYNHFQNNRELTTKSGLLKNLRNITDFKVNIDKFFPRCYDLGDGVQVKELIKDYNRTAILNILKKYINGLSIDKSLLNLCQSYAEHLLLDLTSKCEKPLKTIEIRPEDIKKCIELVPEPIPPSLIDQVKTQQISQLLNSLHSFLPQLQMEGKENIWIIKPGQNARGSGVRCVRDLDEILDSGWKMQSRVVQKYTESPLLIPLPMGMCKFDLRIWVLVSSIDPLEVYMYNTCYCRICQEPYNLSSLDPFRHLANYSIQKSVAKSQSSTIWTLSQLVSYLDSLHVSWLDILPKIHYIIIQSLASVAELMETRPGCFELYGFDILLDSFFEPWLLEVNLSPACAERTDWISETLDFMGEGILKIVLDTQPQVPVYNQMMKPQREIKGNTQEWVMIFKGVTCEDFNNIKCNLEIIGEKFNVKREKNLERRYLMAKAAGFLQYHVRKYLAKVRVEKLKVNHCVFKFQQVFRRRLALDKVKMRVRIKFCIRIQSFFRMKLSQRLRRNLEFLKNVTIVQAVIRSYKEQRRFKSIKEIRSCVQIQAILRQKLSRNLVKAKKHYLKSVIFIQKTWKTFYQSKIKTVKNLQQVLRGFIDRVDVKKRFSFKAAIINIQKSYRKFQSTQHITALKIQKAKSIISQYEKFRIIIKSLSLLRSGNSAVIIQKYWRRHHSKKILKLKQEQKQFFLLQICFIQKIVKGFKDRKKFEKALKSKSAIKIQKNFRGFRARKYFKVLRQVNYSAVLIQKQFRKYLARKRYLIMRRIFREEQQRRINFISKKKDLEKRAMKATERLFKGKAMPEVPVPAMAKAEKLLYEKEEKIERIRTIYNQIDENLLINAKYERSSLIKSIIEDMKPRRDKSKSKKSKKNKSIWMQNSKVK